MKVNVAGRALTPAVYVTAGALLATAAAVWAGGWLRRRARYAERRQRKRRDRERALRALQERIDADPDTLSDEKRSEILKLDLVTLRDKMRAGDLHPRQVLRAYQIQALEAHKKTNCIVEPIVEAEAWADELAASGSRDGVLYGVPVSVKDQFPVKGYDSTIGCSGWIDRPFEDDCVMIKVLKAEGAIPFVKTNVPQTMLSPETTNPIYGATRNAQDASRTAGGSSGGEGALIGAGGALVGMGVTKLERRAKVLPKTKWQVSIGSDIGGSIRIPAVMNGVCGFKPTAARLSHLGDHPFGEGQNSVPGCVGPLARRVAGCAEVMRALCSPRTWHLDPAVPRMPFDDEVYTGGGGLRVGYFTDCPSFCAATPAMQRAVTETRARLEEAGHTLVAWSLTAGCEEELAEAWSRGVFADGGAFISDVMVGDTTDEAMFLMRPLFCLPVFLRKLLAFIAYPLDKNQSKMLRWTCGVSSGSELYAVNATIAALRARVFAAWRESRLDALICPAYACPPLPFGDLGLASNSAFYTFMYNVLDFPAGTLPVTKVTKDDVSKMASYPVPDIGHRVIRKGQKNTEGLAVNVQVVTLPWQEELCLRVMREVEAVVPHRH